MYLWVGTVVLLSWFGLLLWISIRHNIRTVCRQVLIFHPWCDGGGGGEKCLWLILKEFCDQACEDMKFSQVYQSSGGRIRYKKPIRITILCHLTTPHVQDLLNDVDRAFSIKIPTVYGCSDQWQEKSRNTTRLNQFVTLRIVRLQSASLAVKSYPFATQFLQAAAGFLLAFEAALKTKGNSYDTIWDTTGLPTTIAAYNWLTTMMRRRAYAYVHYPFISPNPTPRNLLQQQEILLKETRTEQERAKETRGGYEVSMWRRAYHLMNTKIYALSTACYRQPIVVNSTYTERRLKALWPRRRILKVLPPVSDAYIAPAANDGVSSGGLATKKKQPAVISVAQYRREKRHFYQIELIAALLKSNAAKGGTELPPSCKFYICGSCRPKTSSNDEQLVYEILRYADSLCGNIARIDLHCHSKLDRIKWAPSHCLVDSPYAIEFHVNLSTKQLRQLVAAATVGLHTMIDEHLGISVAEMAINKLFVVAHNSAGPRDDILRPPSASEWNAELEEAFGPFAPNRSLGALCDSTEEFVEALKRGLRGDQAEQQSAELASRMVRTRFPCARTYGKDMLNAWNLYTRKVD